MAKPEWGTKRICLSCGTRFYDLQRDPIVCPSCETSFKPDDFLRTRRTRGQAEEAPRAKAAPARSKKAAAVDDLAEGEEPLDETEESEEDEDQGVIEDTSDLGEDDDDVAEVIENVDEEEGDTER